MLSTPTNQKYEKAMTLNPAYGGTLERDAHQEINGDSTTNVYYSTVSESVACAPGSYEAAVRLNPGYTTTNGYEAPTRLNPRYVVPNANVAGYAQPGRLGVKINPSYVSGQHPIAPDYERPLAPDYERPLALKPSYQARRDTVWHSDHRIPNAHLTVRRKQTRGGHVVVTQNGLDFEIPMDSTISGSRRGYSAAVPPVTQPATNSTSRATQSYGQAKGFSDA